MFDFGLLQENYPNTIRPAQALRVNITRSDGSDRLVGFIFQSDRRAFVWSRYLHRVEQVTSQRNLELAVRRLVTESERYGHYIDEIERLFSGDLADQFDKLCRGSWAREVKPTEHGIRCHVHNKKMPLCETAEDVISEIREYVKTIERQP